MVKPFNRPHPYRTAFFPLIALFLFLNIHTTSAQDGKQIFKGNCATCHSLGSKMGTGPGLEGVSTKHDKDWGFTWIKDNVSLTNSGDPEAVTASGITGTTMTVFAGVLTDEQIRAVVDYVWSEPGEPVKITGGPTVTEGGDGEETEAGINPFYLTLIIIAILLILVSALKAIRRNMQNAVNEKQGLPPMPEYNWRQWASHN